jgi:integrase
MSSIHKRGARFRVMWSVYVDGKRILKGQSFPTLAAAKTFAAGRAAEEARGLGGAPQSLGTFLTLWLERKRGEVRATTFVGYERNCGFIQRHAIAKESLDRVTALHLERFYSELAKKPAGRGKLPSARTVHHVHALLQNALGDAQRWRLVAENAGALAKSPKVAARRAPIPSGEQVAAFLRDLGRNNDALLPLAALAVSTGMRRGELLGLRISDVDWQRHRLRIDQMVEEVKGDFRVRDGVKSLSSARAIKVAPEVIALLEQQRVRVREQQLKLGSAWTDCGLLFPDMLSGGPLRPAGVTKAFGRAARRVGWPKGAAAVHGLRHYAASSALANGGALAAVAKRLGHSSPHVTAAIYLHSETALDEQAADAMAANLVLPKRAG